MFADGSEGTYLIYALAVEGHASEGGGQALVVGRRQVSPVEIDSISSEWNAWRFAKTFEQQEEGENQVCFQPCVALRSHNASHCNIVSQCLCDEQNELVVLDTVAPSRAGSLFVTMSTHVQNFDLSRSVSQAFKDQVFTQLLLDTDLLPVQSKRTCSITDMSIRKGLSKVRQSHLARRSCSRSSKPVPSGSGREGKDLCSQAAPCPSPAGPPARGVS